MRPGGVVVNTVPTIPIPADETHAVRGVGVFVRNATEQLTRLVEMVDRGELRVEVAERVPLDQLTDVHANAAAGELAGRVSRHPERHH